MTRETCHGCDVKEGQIHEFGCDCERCPFCGGQVISCGCGDKITEKQFLLKMEKKGRIPYILYPNLCCKCGNLWPDMFSVPDEEWKKYVSPDERNEMLCRKCYNQIKKWIDGNGGRK